MADTRTYACNTQNEPMDKRATASSTTTHTAEFQVGSVQMMKKKKEENHSPAEEARHGDAAPFLPRQRNAFRIQQTL